MNNFRQTARAAALMLALAASMPIGTAHAATSLTPVDRVVAVVNSDVITEVELNNKVRAVERDLRRQNVESPPPDVLRSQVLERLITDRAQLQLARESGIRIDDGQLDRAVTGIAQQNQLTVPELRTRVEQEGMSYARFRDDVRAELMITRLREREVDARVQISEADVNALLAERNARGAAQNDQELNLSHILVRVPEGASAEQISTQRARADEIMRMIKEGAEFGRLAASYSDAPDSTSGGSLGWRSIDRLPQLFVQAVDRLKPGETTQVLRSPNGFHILKLVERRVANAGPSPTDTVRQTHARHILIRQTEVVSESEALRRLREIRERVERGTATFADMARQYSVDGSAGNGGDLGWVYEGDTVPQFERAMDQLKPGEISEPVRTPFGWHLIQVIERRTDTASEDRVRNLAKQALRERRSDEAYQDWLRQLRDRTYVEYRNE